MLKQPCFAQNLIAPMQVQFDVHGVLRPRGEIEHGTPNVRIHNRIDGLPLDEAQRSAHNQFDIAPPRELAELTAFKIDHVFGRVFRARLPRYAALA